MHRGAGLAHRFGEPIDGGEDRVGLLVQQQMVIMEMPAADVPVKILGLQVEREGVGQKRVERARDLVSPGFAQVGPSC